MYILQFSVCHCSPRYYYEQVWAFSGIVPFRPSYFYGFSWLYGFCFQFACIFRGVFYVRVFCLGIGLFYWLTPCWCDHGSERLELKVSHSIQFIISATKTAMKKKTFDVIDFVPQLDFDVCLLWLHTVKARTATCCQENVQWLCKSLKRVVKFGEKLYSVFRTNMAQNEPRKSVLFTKTDRHPLSDRTNLFRNLVEASINSCRDGKKNYLSLSSDAKTKGPLVNERSNLHRKGICL